MLCFMRPVLLLPLLLLFPLAHLYFLFHLLLYSKIMEHTSLSQLVHLFPLLLPLFLLVPAIVLLFLLTRHILSLFLLHPSILIFQSLLMFLPLHNLISRDDLEDNTPLILISKTMSVTYLPFLDLLPLLPVWNLNLFFILKLPQFQLGRMP